MIAILLFGKSRAVLRKAGAGLCWSALIVILTFFVSVDARGQANNSKTIQPVAPPAIPVAGAADISASQHPDATLQLGTGDLLDVRVFDTPELSEKLRVDENGEITLPIGGAVVVGGLTAEQVRVAIEQRLRERDILHDPHVDVFVDQYATQGVTVAGEVKTPGIYPWIGKHSVLDFISAAGGLTPFASHTVTISRKDREQVITFQLKDNMQTPGGADMEARPGDRILVVRSGVVYVVGDVGRPGGYLIDNNDSVTVLKALALAQGMNKTARFDAKLIRNSPSGRTESDLPLKKILANQATDPKLEDGDIVFIPVSGGKQFADKGVTAILQTAVGVVIYGRL